MPTAGPRPGGVTARELRCAHRDRCRLVGAVPNVVYSCGALVHAETLVIPYGIGDAAIEVDTAPLPQPLAALSG